MDIDANINADANTARGFTIDFPEKWSEPRTSINIFTALYGNTTMHVVLCALLLCLIFFSIALGLLEVLWPSQFIWVMSSWSIYLTSFPGQA